MKNTVAEMKTALEAIDSRVVNMKEWAGDLGDRIVEIIQSKQQDKKKNFKK